MIPFMAPMMMGAAGGLVVGPASGWNAANKGTNVVLSNNNLTATGPTTYGDSLTRGVNGRSSGRYSFRISNLDNGFAGVANTTQANNGQFPGANANSVGYQNYGTSRGVFASGSRLNTGIGASGDAIDLIVDLDARKVWFIVGGVNVFNGGDPAAGTGGWICPAGAIFPAVDAADNSIVATLDTTLSRYAGFLPWG